MHEDKEEIRKMRKQLEAEKAELEKQKGNMRGEWMKREEEDVIILIDSNDEGTDGGHLEREMEKNTENFEKQEEIGNFDENLVDLNREKENTDEKTEIT